MGIEAETQLLRGEDVEESRVILQRPVKLPGLKGSARLPASPLRQIDDELVGLLGKLAHGGDSHAIEQDSSHLIALLPIDRDAIIKSSPDGAEG
jgi:hypothetical protein